MNSRSDQPTCLVTGGGLGLLGFLGAPLAAGGLLLTFLPVFLRDYEFGAATVTILGIVGVLGLVGGAFLLLNIGWGDVIVDAEKREVVRYFPLNLLVWKRHSFDVFDTIRVRKKVIVRRGRRTVYMIVELLGPRLKLTLDSYEKTGLTLLGKSLRVEQNGNWKELGIPRDSKLAARRLAGQAQHVLQLPIEDHLEDSARPVRTEPDGRLQPPQPASSDVGALSTKRIDVEWDGLRIRGGGWKSFITHAGVGVWGTFCIGLLIHYRFGATARTSMAAIALVCGLLLIGILVESSRLAFTRVSVRSEDDQLRIDVQSPLGGGEAILPKDGVRSVNNEKPAWLSRLLGGYRVGRTLQVRHASGELNVAEDLTVPEAEWLRNWFEAECVLPASQGKGFRRRPG